MNSIFDSVFDTVGTDGPQGFIICIAAARQCSKHHQ